MRFRTFASVFLHDDFYVRFCISIDMTKKLELIREQQAYIQQLMRMYKTNSTNLGKGAGVAHTTINRLVNNKPEDVPSALGSTTLKKLEQKYPLRIPRVGVVMTGMIVETFKNDEVLSYLDTPAGIDYSYEIEAFEFIDDSNAPLAYKGWIYLITRKIKPNSTSTFSQHSPYWVKLKNGDTYIRKIRAGYEPGRFHLIHPISADIIENSDIECYAEIRIIPKYDHPSGTRLTP